MTTISKYTLKTAKIVLIEFVEIWQFGEDFSDSTTIIALINSVNNKDFG